VRPGHYPVAPAAARRPVRRGFTIRRKSRPISSSLGKWTTRCCWNRRSCSSADDRTR
jgi:hypothetical protein